MELIAIILNYVSLVISLLGAAIVLWGMLLTIVRFIRLEFSLAKDAKSCKERETLKHSFGSYLLLGLEFLIAADIIGTITNPTL